MLIYYIITHYLHNLINMMNIIYLGIWIFVVSIIYYKIYELFSEIYKLDMKKFMKSINNHDVFFYARWIISRGLLLPPPLNLFVYIFYITICQFTKNMLYSFVFIILIDLKFFERSVHVEFIEICLLGQFGQVRFRSWR